MKSKFDGLFELLTGNKPFPWQKALAQRFLINDIPPGCDLPTGMGKTSVIPIWAICLGLQAMAGNVLLPRRLIYTVNCRVIVDQATEEVNRIIQVLSSSNEPAILNLREALVSLAATANGSPIAVSTLRGGLADNQEWKADPTRPAIVIGTVDMIGSKLFFCGYRDGRRERALHAGLLGQDSLIVHDESHLMPAFGRSLREAQTLNTRGIALRPFAIMDLSATQEGISRDGIISLSDADLTHPVIRQRAGLREGRGRKKLNLQVASKMDAAALMGELATMPQLNGSAVLVYVRTVDLAKIVREKLAKVLGKKQEENVIVLTGTLRGHERDQLTALPGFKRFSPGRDRSKGLAETVCLVSTAAGEVGVNLDADHCICELSTLESMIQRFGRVNRMGLFPESVIEAVAIKEEMAQKQLRR
jgi:CRISPR-associated endonuclease/helicase Cas3